MTTKYWIGGATAVAQVHTGSIDSLDGTPADNTFTVTIGGVAISQAGDTDVATTAAALVALLNASTHPYFAAITWTNPSSGNIVGTADTAGVPFEAALTETGAGTGSVTDFAETTASEGPNDWSTPENWSDGAVPANSDDVVLANSNVDIVYGLDQNSLTLDSFTIEQTYTGVLGLPANKFATDAAATEFSTTVPEYRETYLKADIDVVDIGQHFGPGQPNGSGRVKINNVKAGSSVTTVYNTKQSASETGQPAVRLLFDNAGADLFVRAAPGGVGVATDSPGETSTMGDISVSNGNVYVGAGVTWTNGFFYGGTSVIQAANSPTTIDAKGGSLTTEGDFTLTTLNIEGGVVNCNHIKTGGNAVTTVNLESGTLNGATNTEARTWATVNPNGGTLIVDEHITMTTINEPAGPVSISIIET